MITLLVQVLRFSVVLGFVLTAGCAIDVPAVAPDSYLSGTLKRPKAQELVLLVHEPATDPVLQSGDQLAAAEVNKQLVSAGLRVTSLPIEDFRKLHASEVPDSIARTGVISRKEYEAASMRALRQLASIGAAEANAVMVLRTRLVTRPTTIWQSHATWDGQRRPILFEGEGPVRIEIQGTGPGVSIELLGIQADRTISVRSFGGISLPYRQHRRTGQPSDRTDLFDQTAELTQGIAIALAPLLGSKP